MSEHPTLSIDEARLEAVDDLESVRKKALGTGVVGALATAAGYFVVGPDVFYRAYLVGWLFWLGIAAGLLTIGMLAQIAGGRWGIQMRRVHEASGRSLWMFLVLALPICFGGMPHLFSWSVPEKVAGDALVQAKTGYLKLWFAFEGTNPDWMSMVPGFIPRMAIIILIWWLWAHVLTRQSQKFDETGDMAVRDSQLKWCAGGLVVFVLVGTFASIDWVMSTDPHWFSSLYGPQFLVWQVLSAMAFSIPLLIFFGKRKPLDRFIQPTHFHDYGKWMLAFTMVWGYFTASQIIIIWSGNLPEEIGWYIHRSTEGWWWFTLFYVIFTFFVPFVILLQQPLKFKPQVLFKVAMLILVTRWFDYYWQIAPNLHPEGFTIHVFDFVVPVGIGGLWIWHFFGQIKGRVLVPIHDPIIEEALADG